MKFEELEAGLRAYEIAHDRCVPAGVTIVVRLDGRHFTRLTKEVLTLEAPFDLTFRDAMLVTAEHVMMCGFAVVYGYTQSDEISLLLAQNEDAFGRKERKLLSILAGEASAQLSLTLGTVATFDARICELPDEETVVDYFRWRQEDARRNALASHCYWALRRDGQTPSAATTELNGTPVAEKRALLARHGIQFDDLPAWQRRGTGLLWEDYQKPIENPISSSPAVAVRRRIRRELELPEGSEYSAQRCSRAPARPDQTTG